MYSIFILYRKKNNNEKRQRVLEVLPDRAAEPEATNKTKFSYTQGVLVFLHFELEEYIETSSTGIQYCIYCIIE